MPRRGRSDPGSGSGSPKYPGTFILAFKEAAAILKMRVERLLGNSVECVDAQGRNLVVGLENLYRLARREERARWPDLIADFIRTAQTVPDTQQLTPELTEVADKLLVRLGQPLQSMPADARVWSRPLAETDLCLNLVIDHEKSFSYVTEKQVEESARPADEWLERALANLRARTPPDCFEVIDEESGMRLCAVGDAYDSSRVLLLESHLPQAGADGYFVAVPARDCVLVLPVDEQGLGCVHLLKVLAEKNFKTSPYSITDAIFWVRDGIWRYFHIRIKGQAATIEPPAEFIEVLDRLAPEDEDADLDDLPDF